MKKYLETGKIVGTHGVKGTMRVQPWCDSGEFLKQFKFVYLDKNGEEKIFQIDEQEAKIYVIADKLSKNYCNEFYQLSAGQEDVFLSGKNKFNLANSNAFRFDNNESEENIANRKRVT